jgi:hypothetical protein
MADFELLSGCISDIISVSVTHLYFRYVLLMDKSKSK